MTMDYAKSIILTYSTQCLQGVENLFLTAHKYNFFDTNTAVKILYAPFLLIGCADSA